MLVTDPPYGIDDQGGEPDALDRSPSWAAISGDANTGIRDEVLDMWANMRPAVVFGSALKAPPDGARQALVEPDNMGISGTVRTVARLGVHTLRGDSLKRGGAESGVIVTPRSWETTGHRHSKPVALMERLVALFPGVIADRRVAGSGSTLVAGAQPRPPRHRCGDRGTLLRGRRTQARPGLPGPRRRRQLTPCVRGCLRNGHEPPCTCTLDCPPHTDHCPGCLPAEAERGRHLCRWCHRALTDGSADANSPTAPTVSRGSGTTCSPCATRA